MRTINVSQFERHPQWRVELVVIQRQPYLEGVRLTHVLRDSVIDVCRTH